MANQVRVGTFIYRINPDNDKQMQRCQYGCNCWSRVAEFNGNYSFLQSLFNTSDLAFMRAIGASMKDIFHMTDDNGNEVISPIIDETGVVPQGQISFWQKIVEFFKQIINFFKNLFNKEPEPEVVEEPVEEEPEGPDPLADELTLF